MTNKQNFAVRLTIWGEDNQVYYDETKTFGEVAKYTFKKSYIPLWTIPLQFYLTKTQKYQIILTLFNETEYAVDVISIPMFHYTANYNYQINVENVNFAAVVDSNSTISNFNFTKEEKKISFMVEGEPGTIGYCNITIPIELLGGPYTVTFDNETILQKYDAPTNGTHAFIYITYNHSTHTIEIIGTTVIPEYPSLALLLVSSLPIALMIALLKGKYKKHNKTT